MNANLRTFFCCALFLLAAPALAGDTSVIVGTVVSAETKKPLEDVVVTATAPSLQGEQVVVTDAQGQYRIPGLPEGVYTLRFEMEGFEPYGRTGIDLRANRPIQVNEELVPVPFTGDLIITNTPPGIDVGSTFPGFEVDQEFIRRIQVKHAGP